MTDKYAHLIDLLLRTDQVATLEEMKPLFAEIVGCLQHMLVDLHHMIAGYESQTTFWQQQQATYEAIAAQHETIHTAYYRGFVDGRKCSRVLLTSEGHNT